MTWDSSRIAAAIPSGVGFLGAGLIFKDSQQNKKTGYTSHVVHGLTTSASLWIVS
jgi:putative Mg2+ transporter-C (MgtC) family protein